MKRKPAANGGSMKRPYAAQPSSRLAKNAGDDKVSEIKTQKTKGGLNIELHPLLRQINTVDALPKVQNPTRRNVRSTFDPAAINPYLDPSDMALSRRKISKGLQFNAPGKYIEEADRIRQQEAQKREEETQRKLLQDRGLLENEELGEHLYKEQHPPNLEWWDSFYIKGNSYELIDDEKNLEFENDVAPVSIYIQHPVLPAAANSKHQVDEKSMYLTKKELKRKRRNERQEKYKEQQDRIRLGLDPPPPPKVKLSNLMNVLTNEAIQDPTAVEQRVRREVEERYKKHMEQNNDRKLTREQIHLKEHEKRQRDINTGYFSCVFKVNKLVHPQHFFKVDKNAKQLELKGVCLVTPDLTLVVVEGGSKSINFYKRLMTRRIQWKQEPVETTDTHEDIDLSDNRCELLWEGQIKEFNFKKWSIFKVKTLEDGTVDPEELHSILSRFNIENYWRQAVSLNSSM